MANLPKISSPATDSDLVQFYHDSGNMEALGELYTRYMELIYGVCLKYLKDVEESQDAVMAIFEELVKKLRQHKVDYFKSWVYTLARNHCLMKLRAQKRGATTKLDETFMQSEAEEHLDEVWNREEDLKKLESCLETLSNHQRKVIKLFYLQGKCYNEISEETGIEWSSIRSYIQNGRRNLKLCMEGERKKITSNE